MSAFPNRPSELSILVSAPYLLRVIDRFQAVFDRAGLRVILAEVEERLSSEQLFRHAGEYDGTICGDDMYSAEVLEAAAPRLKVISKWGTGIDSIDSKAATRLGIQVRNTPGAFTEAVADTVLAYVLTFARGVPWMDRSVRAGEWNKHPGKSLSECTLGVVGVGRIGRAVLERATAFGMKLLGNDVVTVDLGGLPARLVGLEQLLEASDYVSLNCDLNPGSRHLINETTLGRLRPDAVLINTARGSVVDEMALTAALRSGKLGGAALDVFEQEPLPANSPLRGLDNVLLAPHNSNSSPAAWERVHWNTIGNLFEGLGLSRPEPSPVVQVAPVQR